jgi:hypothetical protein
MAARVPEVISRNAAPGNYDRRAEATQQEAVVTTQTSDKPRIEAAAAQKMNAVRAAFKAGAKPSQAVAADVRIYGRDTSGTLCCFLPTN